MALAVGVVLRERLAVAELEGESVLLGELDSEREGEPLAELDADVDSVAVQERVLVAEAVAVGEREAAARQGSAMPERALAGTPRRSPPLPQTRDVA